MDNVIQLLEIFLLKIIIKQADRKQPMKNKEHVAQWTM